MTSDTIIAISAAAEPWIVAGALGTAIVLAARTVLTRRSRAVAAGTLDAPIDRRTEGIVLVCIVAVAFATRVVGWDDALTPVFWFSQVPTLYVDRILHEGSFWTSLAHDFRATQVGWAHESVVLLPVLAALQRWLGPRFGVPVLAGSLAGTLAVVLAWALGRRMRSQAFGLLFAAFVAASPLELTWSRLGGYYIAAIPHVLLALLVGHAAGRRGSLVLAAVAGFVAWASLYQYYAARVAIPLSVLAMLAGTSHWTSMPRRLLLVLAWAIAFAGIGWALAPGTVGQTLWPAYGGYAGNNGEQSLGEFVSRNLPAFIEQARVVPERYFLRLRAMMPSLGYETGLQHGGLSLVPTAILGAVGLLVVARRFRSQWLWVAVAAAGLALPIISTTTARRLLVFDLAWCAFAAHGLLAVVDGVAAAWSRRTRAVLVAAVVGSVAAWSALAVFALSAGLPAGGMQPIPFGEAGFGDGTTCKRCLEAAKQWQRDITAGGFVLLFDNDRIRENRTSPGGLPVYGKIAAAGAGKQLAFVEVYTLMANWDGEAPTPGSVFFDGRDGDFATALVERMERVAPERIVWQFERPTAWERWLARRLTDAGGTSESFSTPLSATPGERVVTPWERRDGAFAVLRALAAGSRPAEDTPCVTVIEHGAFSMAGPVLLLAAAPGSGMTSPPEWLGSSWLEVRLGSHRFEYPTTIGAVVPAAAADPLELMGGFGRHVAIDRASGIGTPLEPNPTGNPGFDCAMHAARHWWTVDPLTGHVASTHPNGAALPEGAWIGAARGLGDEIVLASAEQALVVFDVESSQVVRRVPARVSPSVRVSTDECTQIAVGEEWIVTVDLLTGVASFFDRQGRALGTKRLDPEKHVGEMITAVAGAGHYLGVGASSGLVRTLEVTIDPTCDPARVGAAPN